MRKVSVLVMVSIIVMSLLLPSTVAAAGTPPPALSSGFQLQNRSTTDTANVQIVYYNAGGSAVETDSDSIPAKASRSYYVPNVLGQPDGRYSIVVNSDQELFSLVNEVTSSASDRYVAATHSAFSGDEIGSPLYLPWVVASYYGYNSMFAIQNAGSAATDITVEFYQSGQSTPKKTYNFNVATGGAVYLDMLQSPYSTELAGFFGGVKIYSTGNATPLAAVLNDTNPAGSFLRSYNAVKSGGTDLIAPQVTANYYGYSTGITLQNPGSIAATVVISYYLSGQSTPTTVQNLTIPGSSVQAIYLPNVSGMVTNFNGSAVIHSNVELIGIANHDHVPAGPAASYNLIPKTQASQTVYMPQIVRAYYGFESGYMLFNPGPEQVAVSVEFFKTDGTSVTTINHTIPANSAMTMYLGDTRGAALGTNFNGGAKAVITAGNGGLVGIANFVAPKQGDNMQVYNVFIP